MAFAGYLKQGGVLPQLLIGGADYAPTITAAALVVLISGVHFLKVSVGSTFQNIFTSFSILTILFIIVSGLLAARSGNASFRYTPDVLREIGSS